MDDAMPHLFTPTRGTALRRRQWKEVPVRFRDVAVTLRDTHPHYQQHVAAGAFVEVLEVL